MGWFDFWQSDPEQLTYEEVEDWLDTYKEEEIAPIIRSLQEDIDATLERAREAVDELETADLMNPNIEERKKQMMRDNRDVFIRRIRTFLDGTEVPESDMIEPFIQEYEDRLDRFSERTKKNTAILEQFFKTEMREIGSTLHKILDRAEQARDELDAANADTVTAVQDLVEERRDALQRKDELQERIEEHTEHIEQLQEDVEDRADEVQDIQESDRFQTVQELEEHVEELREDIEGIRSEIREDIAALRRPLTKFAHGSSDEELVEHALDDPDTALKESFADLLEELREHLDEIDLSERTRTSAEEQLEAMGAEYVEEQRERLEALQEELGSVLNEIEQSAVQDELRRAQRRKERDEETLEDAKQDCERLREELESLDPASLKRDVKERMEDAFNVVVELDPTEDKNGSPQKR